MRQLDYNTASPDFKNPVQKIKPIRTAI